MLVDFHEGEGTTYDVDEANGNDSSRGIGQSRLGPGKCTLCGHCTGLSQQFSA